MLVLLCQPACRVSVFCGGGAGVGKGGGGGWEEGGGGLGGGGGVGRRGGPANRLSVIGIKINVETGKINGAQFLKKT